ncbi:MAG TPA: hypothetical protein VMA35_00695 [Candidatus Sulfopaludibacter sp.]|nr:hypothetical protein [Candidatus Sulfopaludibacter sp.]
MVKYTGKIFLCALSSVIGTLIGGVFSTVLHLEQPRLPGPVNTQLLALLCLAGGFVLSMALATLSPRLQGNRRSRFAVIAWFVFAWLGINNTIEAGIFTTMGGSPTVITTMLFQSLFVAGAVVLMFSHQRPGKSSPEVIRRFFASRTAAQWAVRLASAVAAFPLIYFLFGMPVGLMVGKSYQSQSFNLQMPTLNVVIGVQSLRSLTALAAVLPMLALWTGSRQRFAWTFGLSLFLVAGLYGLIQAYWMPWTLRSIHTVELFLDSMVYGWLVAMWLLPRPSAMAGEMGARNNRI